MSFPHCLGFLAESNGTYRLYVMDPVKSGPHLASWEFWKRALLPSLFPDVKCYCAIEIWHFQTSKETLCVVGSIVFNVRSELVSLKESSDKGTHGKCNTLHACVQSVFCVANSHSLVLLDVFCLYPVMSGEQNVDKAQASPDSLDDWWFQPR